MAKGSEMNKTLGRRSLLKLATMYSVTFTMPVLKLFSLNNPYIYRRFNKGDIIPSFLLPKQTEGYIIKAGQSILVKRTPHNSLFFSQFPTTIQQIDIGGLNVDLILEGKNIADPSKVWIPEGFVFLGKGA